MQEFNFQEFLPLAIEFVKNHALMMMAWLVLFVMTIYYFYKEATRKYQVIENDEAIRLMNTQDAVVVDLRSMEEFDRGHIVGSVNIVPQDIKDNNLGKLDKNKAVPVIVVDQLGENGVNTGKSAELLTKEGFTQVYLLKEGIAGWNGANLPLVNKHKK